MTLDEFLALPGAKRHDGGPCPIRQGSKPTYLCRNGWSGSPADGRCAGDFVWRWGPQREPSDIIAYREAQP
jgi:hypothetical protein